MAASVSSLRLSDEQQRILQQAHPPGVSRIVRVTAAAGTGKTTTLLKLAERCVALGCTSITYVTFNKAAADDGRRRLGQHIRESSTAAAGAKAKAGAAAAAAAAAMTNGSVNLDVRTLHSCAMNLLSRRRNEEYKEDLNEDTLMNESQLMEQIERVCKEDVRSFLKDCYREIWRITRHGNNEVRNSMQLRARKQVYFFIFKTLKAFCQSSHSEEVWMDPTNEFERNYYPAVLYHKENGGGEKAGFLVEDYLHCARFYADQANKVWLRLNHVRTYDFEMKRAQLLGLEIPGSVVLVDECQDMDACQVDWLANQAKQSKQIFFVGDAAQTIYSFRGARSTAIMNLDDNVVDCTLTKSWRFGPSIASIANIVLFAKENSPQTTGKTKRWQPYRVKGAGKSRGEVTSESLLRDWQRQKVTLIAFTNVTLLTRAVQMMGTALPGDEEKEEQEQKQCRFEPSKLPKFSINGSGESSGKKKWKKVIGEIEALYTLFMAHFPISLPALRFPEFAGQVLTWESFVDQVNELELGRYYASVSVISNFGKRTMEAMKLFQDHVLNRNCSASEADVILTTCHAAKGLEWDNVEVCEDFIDLTSVAKAPHTQGETHGYYAGRREQKGRTSRNWHFNFRPYGDDVNLLYVACTRARKKLCVPQSLLGFLRECDLLKDILESKRPHSNSNSNSNSNSSVSGSSREGKRVLFRQEKPLSYQDLSDLYKTLVNPLRQELGLEQRHKMEGTLMDKTKELPEFVPSKEPPSACVPPQSKSDEVPTSVHFVTAAKGRIISKSTLEAAKRKFSFRKVNSPSQSHRAPSKVGGRGKKKGMKRCKEEVIEILDGSPAKPKSIRFKKKGKPAPEAVSLID